MKHITTHIFDNLQIDGKVSNNTLLIGSGVDEEIKLQVGKTDGTNPAIRYVPAVTSSKIVGIKVEGAGSSELNGIYDTIDNSGSSIKYTRTVDGTNYWVDFSGTVWSVGVGSGANYYYCHSTNTTPDGLVFTATAYGQSPVPTLTGLYETGAPAHLEYTNDGVTWKQFSNGSSSTVTYTPILFDSSHFTSGKVTILHNLGHLPLCLDYTPVPQDVIISATQIVLDYGDQSNGTEATGFVITDCSYTSANGVYTLVSGAGADRVWKNANDYTVSKGSTINNYWKLHDDAGTMFSFNATNYSSGDPWDSVWQKPNSLTAETAPVLTHQEATTFSGACWFIDSAQDMLQAIVLPDPPTGYYCVVAGAGDSSANGEFVSTNAYTTDGDRANIVEGTVAFYRKNNTNIALRWNKNASNLYRWEIFLVNTDTILYYSRGISGTTPAYWPWGDNGNWSVASGTAPAPTTVTGKNPDGTDL